ncbi:MAG: 3-oxoacyl-ACP synthase III family protein, partial [Deltaproteobacteria bacterium]|nr:3-oxoacyl-ACP synthase III family protein [Deltaproteobacteria bacterium]
MATAACVVRPAVVRISGMGEALPGHILSSAALEARLHLEEGWIVRRTGIVSRHLLGDDEPLCELAASAVRAACDDAGCAPEDLDAIIATATCPDASLPSLASRVASLLAVDPPSVFDVAASSAGFLAGLAVAEGFIARGRARRVALVAAEALSRCVDWEDRETCVLFGDGCAAAIL